MKDPETLKRGALVSAAYDTLLQMSLRVLSFVLNAFIVRHVSREVFAVMTVRLNLLYATGLLLSREAFRRAALSSKGIGDIQKVINLIWIGPLVSGPVCLFGWYVWLHAMEQPPETVTRNYSAGVTFMALSVVVEVLAEVPFVLAELQLWSKTKVVIEGLMQLLRSVLLAAFVYLWPFQAVFMYGVSQFLGSLLYCFSYYGLFVHTLSKKEEAAKLPIKNLRQMLPRTEGHKRLPEIDAEMGAISWSFFKQGWLKEALTEGELYLMNFFSLISLAQQGVYQVVSNLGSLAARLVFRSIEAAAYKYFAQMLYRGKSIAEQDQMRVSEVARFLSMLLRSLLLVSFIILSFGWSYSHLLLTLYGGSQLSDGGGTPLMRAQCFFVVFLAVNGITEAYTFAAMNDKELERYNYLLVSFSIAYIGMAVVLTQVFSALGFLYANCINMSLRIIYSLWFIHKQFRGSDHQPLTGLYIPMRLILMFLMAAGVTAVSEVVIYPRSIIMHILIGGVCLVVVAYFLRWELKALYEKILGILSKFLTRSEDRNRQLSGDKFSHVWVVNKIHSVLYSCDKKKSE
ncbi:protein RFT1 homolog [Penaeus japonicus]|uniref:protein RFT1 homolog n=1 Tax=Penaeus japonicus TaxID=27405 RepID=UPI001C71185A|nr:protein RFT1 homolog [Penaeus japonicus]